MARGFDGVAQNLGINQPVVLARPFSVAAWFVPPDPAGMVADNVIWQQNDLTDLYRFRLLIEADSGPPNVGTLRASEMQAGTTWSAQSAGVVTMSQWNHGVAVFNTTTDRRVYLDSTDKATNATLSDAFAAAHTASSIGSGAGGAADYFEGRIGHVAIWSRALTDNDVASLFAGASPLQIHPDDLRVYWPMNDVDPVKDVISRANMTPFNGPTLEVEPPLVKPGIIGP
jgi:hypothetical protein